MPSIAALTLFIVYGPFTVSSAWVRNLPRRKPIWLKEPIPPAALDAYFLRIASYSCISGPLWSSGDASSALTNSLWFHFGPSALARKSVLHGVEQPQDFTRSSRPSFWAAWRITRASGGVKLRITEPSGPAELTRLSATELASLIGTFSVSCVIGTPGALARAE